MKTFLYITTFIITIQSTFALRFYNPEYGRWLNRDPIGVDGGINVYNSISNNMVNGFKGGINHSDGIDIRIGELDTIYGIDAWGLEDVEVTAIKQSLSKELKDAILVMLLRGNFINDQTILYHDGDLDAYFLQKAITPEFNPNKFAKGRIKGGDDYRLKRNRTRKVLEYGAVWELLMVNINY